MKNVSCNICPRKCNVERSLDKGFCRVGDKPVVAKAFLHPWEEPCISGSNGSGTVFFSGCNLTCVYCQNYQISQELFGKEITLEQLSQIFLSLQRKGAHNINLVNPTHYTLQLRECIQNTHGLKIPVIYNSNGYESTQGLTAMEGIADVYLPDFKYYNNRTAEIYSGAPNYFETAAAAISEMYRQVGGPVFDAAGMIIKGVIVRHLILPGLAGESIHILDWIRNNLPGDVYVSVMCQYVPMYKAASYPEINRRIIRREYEKVLKHFFKLGFENGYIQERDAAEEEYIPDFNLEGVGEEAGGEPR